jgi:hypothetical protein
LPETSTSDICFFIGHKIGYKEMSPTVGAERRVSIAGSHCDNIGAGTTAEQVPTENPSS